MQKDLIRETCGLTGNDLPRSPQFECQCGARALPPAPPKQESYDSAAKLEALRKDEASNTKKKGCLKEAKTYIAHLSPSHEPSYMAYANESRTRSSMRLFLIFSVLLR